MQVSLLAAWWPLGGLWSEVNDDDVGIRAIPPADWNFVICPRLGQDPSTCVYFDILGQSKIYGMAWHSILCCKHKV
jgi:hypothetical protein